MFLLALWQRYRNMAALSAVYHLIVVGFYVPLTASLAKLRHRPGSAWPKRWQNIEENLTSRPHRDIRGGTI